MYEYTDTVEIQQYWYSCLYALMDLNVCVGVNGWIVFSWVLSVKEHDLVVHGISQLVKII